LKQDNIQYEKRKYGRGTMNLDIFTYTSVRPFLNDYFNESKLIKSLSLRRWSQTMGFRSHSTLHDLLKGKKKITLSHLFYLTNGLELSDKEKQYLSLLIQYENAKDSTEKRPIEKAIIEIRPEESTVVLQEQTFKMISEWFHMAILEFCKQSNVSPSVSEIKSGLSKIVSAQQVDSGIRRLVTLGLLEEEYHAENYTYKPRQNRLTTTDGVSSEAIRNHHGQVLEVAKVALKSQGPEERISNSCAMAIDSSKLLMAQDLITEFRSKLYNMLGTGPVKDKTYQLTIQLFNLTN